MYTCIIVDDEPDAIDGLKKYMESFPELKLIASYTDPVEALRQTLAGPNLDFAFVDIDMPKVNGIELAEEIRSKVGKLVFTTAHSKFAYQAFEVDAEAYLLKPYALGKFITTMSKLLGLRSATPAVKDDFFFVKSKESLKVVKIKYQDIVVIEGKQNYIQIYLKNSNVVTYMSLTQIMQCLKDVPGFLQLHRSFIVQQDCIQSIDGNQVKLLNDMQITVGDTYRKEFNSFVANHLIKAGKRD